YYGGRGGGYYGRRGGGGGYNALGAGLIGFGVGAIVGSALTPREVYVVPPPPPAPVYYEPAAYGPPPWSPDWYTYCYSRYRSFNPNTGTFIGYDGYERLCR
ncbi:MAG: BA14K family protein, partial [Methyloceanibacter sp.]